MLVKKFEAKSMKDALSLVKTHLGPEAIILAAKEYNGGFGLAGQASVEVTAAISEEMLHKKKLAESKLNKVNQESFSGSSARRQKEFINRVFDQHNKADKVRPTITSRQYIDINEDFTEADPEAEVEEQKVHQQQAVPAPMDRDTVAKNRIRSAAANALKAVMNVADFEEAVMPKQVMPQQMQKNGQQERIIANLMNEIKVLRGVVDNFQKVPQKFLTMHPGADFGLSYDLSFMFEKLTKAGVTGELAARILEQCKKYISPEQLKKKAFVDAWVARYFLENVVVTDDWSRGHIHVFLGANGQGKTTSLVKFASHLVINEKRKIAIVAGDGTKVGASEQLRIYAQILNVPFVSLAAGSQWPAIMDQLKGIDTILLDMPGSNLRTEGDKERIESLLPKDVSCVHHYVQSILTKDSDVFEIAERYNKIGFNDVIFTRLDESTQQGLIYNFQQKFGVPLHSFGLGTNVPEDYEVATKERVVDLIFKLTKVRKENHR